MKAEATHDTRRSPLATPSPFSGVGVAQLYILAAFSARNDEMFKQIIVECVRHGVEGEC